MDLAETVSPFQLFDYFALAMQSDTGPGGTHKQWMETKSAISKATSAHEVVALKTACLLGLGLSGERTGGSQELLEFALSPPEEAAKVVLPAVPIDASNAY